MRDGPILVVDDDETILSTVSETLEMEGYRVTTAVNGAEALTAAERTQPTLVLLDMRMPVLDGWGFARAALERGLGLTILVMTAAADAGMWAAEVGAAGYLAKPFDLDDLVATVEQFAGRP